jgi:2-keto-4-pentenoate hydratase
VAFNPRAIQTQLGLPYSLVAGLTHATLRAPGAPYALGASNRVALEAEVAVWLRRDVQAQMGPSDAAACIESWAPAIELVEFDRPLNELEAILAEGVFHRAVYLGAPKRPTAGADLSGISARVEHAGRRLCELDARDATGHVPDVLLHLAGVLQPLGERLAAGDVIILGSMNPLTLAEADTSFSLTLSGVGSVSVTTCR